jgi:hypothetical protein
MFMNGKAARALMTWYDLGSDPCDLLHAQQVNNFANQSVFWDGGGVGGFHGHIHSYLNTMMSLLWEAEATDNSALLNGVKGGFEYVCNNIGNSRIGMFGETCCTGDMLRLAVKLTNNGVADYWEYIDMWVRNGAAELQIMEANIDYVDPNTVLGTFMSDATHLMGIPNSSYEGPFQWVICCNGNLMHGLYDVWKNIVQFNNDLIQVNLLLNRDSEYCMIKSQVPYTGACTVITRDLSGTSLDKMAIRVCNWVNKAQVILLKDGVVDTNWGWAGNYVYIQNVDSYTAYTVAFPMVVQDNVPVSATWADNGMWQESNHPIVPPSTTTYYCKFRGNTLVSCSNRPSTVYPYFIGGNRAYLSTLPENNTYCPFVSCTRWILYEDELLE